MEHMKFLLNTLLSSIQTELDPDLGIRIIENCGRACASECGVLKEIAEIKKKLKNNTSDDLLLDEMNEAGIAGGQLAKKGNVIYGVYNQCYCPSRKDINTPIYCNCTKGWAKAVFETALEKPVEVKLEKAIAWGDECCKFSVKY